jgi:hypothetical protein
LFGCNRRKPFARVDRLGLLWLLNGRKLVMLGADSAAIETEGGGRLTYRRVPNISDQTPAWTWRKPDQQPALIENVHGGSMGVPSS